MFWKTWTHTVINEILFFYYNTYSFTFLLFSSQNKSLLYSLHILYRGLNQPIDIYHYHFYHFYTNKERFVSRPFAKVSSLLWLFRETKIDWKNDWTSDPIEEQCLVHGTGSRTRRAVTGSKTFSTKSSRPSYVATRNGQKIVLHGGGLMRFWIML